MRSVFSRVKRNGSMQVQQAMTQPAVLCGVDDALHVAAQQMWEHDCGAVPVVDAGGVAVGIVTDRDIAMAAYTQGRRLSEIPAGAVTSPRLFCCRPEDSLQDAEALMRDNQIRRIPVVDESGHPVGMLSLGDVARHVKKKRMERSVTKTLAAICTPRVDEPQAGAPSSGIHATAEKSA